jgi:hypothetical protein
MRHWPRAELAVGRIGKHEALALQAHSMRTQPVAVYGQQRFYDRLRLAKDCPEIEVAFTAAIGGSRASADALEAAVELYRQCHVTLTGSEPQPERPQLRIVGDDPAQAA